jgi:hypothetical protein
MRRVLAVGVALVGLFAAGCGTDAGSVTGEVTYDGKLVENGFITFTPADGKGKMVGAPITNGRYYAEKIPPGSKIAKIEASSGPGPSVQSSEDMAKLSKEWKDKVGKDGVIRTETVPADAEGNNQTVEVKQGEQTLNFALKKPPSPGKK